VVHIDDVSSNFDMDTLNSVLSEGLNIEKKFKDVIELPKEETPKFILSSNHILAHEGSTRERRQYIVQFSPYYRDLFKSGILKPIVHEHGNPFFRDEWSLEEWNKFYSFMINCLKYYLNNGLVDAPKLDFAKNAFINKYGPDLFLYFEELELNEGIEYNLKELYQIFKGDDDSPEIGQRGFTISLKNYAILKSINFTLSKGKITFGF